MESRNYFANSSGGDKNLSTIAVALILTFTSPETATVQLWHPV